MLELQNVQMRFGGVLAVKDVSGVVPSGTILGLIGPNGSGKTTLLNVISGVYRPTRGRIAYNGEDITTYRAARVAQVGISRVFQVPQSMPLLTLVENTMIGAMFGARRWSTAESHEASLSALREVGLEHKAAQPASSLTLAERKGLELARLLVAAPTLALVDELLAGLSPAEATAAQNILRRLKAEGTALIVVEHIPGVIADLADEICVLHHGDVLRWGPPSDILSDPDVISAYLGKRSA